MDDRIMPYSRPIISSSQSAVTTEIVMRWWSSVWLIWLDNCLEIRTKSSVVAVIADRTAYDVWYTGKLSKRFRLQVDERLVYSRPMHDPIQRVEFMKMNAPKLYALKRDWPKFSSSRSKWITERYTTSARLIQADCLSQNITTSLRFLRFVFLRYALWLNDTHYSKSVWTDK